VSSLPASVRATGVALNVLLIHLFGDAISPELVGWRSARGLAAGGTPSAALAAALNWVLPAILLSGLALAFARRRRAEA